MTYQEKIEQQELHDRTIAAAILKQSKGVKQIISTDITAPVDLKLLKQDGREIYIEIKEMSGDYPNFLLKEDKYNRIRNYTPEGVGCYYLVFNNGKAYFFNLLTIKWENVKRIMLTQKQTQMNPDSKIVTLPTYLIPRSEAKFVLDINKYYANYKQTKEEASKD